MSENIIESKKELLQEQIENLEKSGFFTEKEMDRLTNPLRKELEDLINLKETISLSVSCAKNMFENELTPKYGNE